MHTRDVQGGGAGKPHRRRWCITARLLHYFHREPIHVCITPSPRLLPPFFPLSPPSPRSPRTLRPLHRASVLRDQIRGHARDGRGRRGRGGLDAAERGRLEREGGRRWRAGKTGGGRKAEMRKGVDSREHALSVLSKDQQALTRRGRTRVRFAARGGKVRGRWWARRGGRDGRICCKYIRGGGKSRSMRVIVIRATM